MASGNPILKLQEIDTEPDIFQYNFGGRSGTFFFNPEGGIYAFPDNDLKIVPLIDEVNHHIISFTVETPDAMIYHFGNEDGATGIEYSKHTNYSLPNFFTYDKNNITFGASDYQINKARLRTASHPYSSFVMSLPVNESYNETYEYHYSVMDGPRYSSKWHLTKVESIQTKEEIELTYNQIDGVKYFENKSLNHTIPNFRINSGTSSGEGGPFIANNNLVSLQLPVNLAFGEYDFGQADLTYSVMETERTVQQLNSILGQRGESINVVYNNSSAQANFDYLPDVPSVDKILLNRVTHLSHKI